MQASLNELTSLLKQAFEGCGLDHSAYENAAELVLWCEVHGFAGFDLLQEAVQRCLRSPHSQLTINQEQAESYEIDMCGDSLLLGGALMNDLTIVKALEKGLCVSQISNARNPILFAKLLDDAWQHGLYGIAYWANDNQAHLISAGEQDYPEYFQCSATNSTAKGVASTALAVTLVYARDQHRVEQHQAKAQNSYGPFDLRHSSSQCEHHYQCTLNEGLEISDSLWSALTRVAANVLVENTEQSRLGAGA